LFVSFCRGAKKRVYTPIWSDGLKLSGIRSILAACAV
jgi:hypothetical protein